MGKLQWGWNLGLIEQKLPKKALFTCVVNAFDTSRHPINRTTDQPNICGPRSRVFSKRSANGQIRTWSVGRLIRCSDECSQQNRIKRKCLWLKNRAHVKSESFIVIPNFGTLSIFLRTLRTHPPSRLRRFRRICRGPGRDSTVPWFDRQLQVELQGFGFGQRFGGEGAVVTQTSARWLTSCARQPYQRSIRLSSSPGGAQTRQTKINTAPIIPLQDHAAQ